MMAERVIPNRPFFVAVLLLAVVLMSSLPLGQANLSDDLTPNTLYLSCIQDDECNLTTAAAGEEIISNNVFASPAQPDTVTLEFDMTPSQNELALLPNLLEKMVVDLRFTGDTTGTSKPELQISLILGSTVTDWEFDAQILPSNAANTPYTLEDEALNLNGNRLLWPDQQVRLRLTFVLDRPGTWELYLRGNSYLDLDIPWSEDVNARNVDEPSSSTQPRETEFETAHYGALLENDRDCWTFPIEQNEVVNIYVEWESVPIELEQTHGLPDLFKPTGRLTETPNVVVREDETSTRITYRWRALDIGEYTLCFDGVAGKFQPYIWTGQLAFESLGPINPDGFSGKSFYPAGTAILGDQSDAVSLETQGSSILIISLVVLVLFGIDGLRNSTSASLRFGIFVPGVVLLLIGGILNPIWGLADEVQTESEITLEQMVDMRLQQLWDVSYPGVPEQVLVTHTGSTWGMLDGDRLELRLQVDEVVPTGDGRWQLVVPELQDFRLDQAIFSQVARGGAQTTNEGMLEEQTVRFILLAGRSLLLDFLMLEALMVVDEEPESSVFHVDFEMVDAPASGSVSVPAWGTRPTSVSEYDWVLLQQALFPDQISVSLCDCDLDLLDVRFSASSGYDFRDVPTQISIENASDMIPFASPLVILGILLCACSSRFEYLRRNNARNLAHQMLHQTKWK
ncbi:MAG: hypothetical protein CMA63_04440 [Euryarchaeota archaeon]|nr:hypothetical protein [Euryarchaeota archaeon]